MRPAPSRPAVAWAAQRSGLYYTAINSHLRHGEVQYILDDCGAKCLVASVGVADVVDALDLSKVPIRLSIGGGPTDEIDGFSPYEEAISTQRSDPVEDECEGREIATVEGMAGESGLHPLQRAFAETGAAQCGYCTPGFLLVAEALLRQKPRASRQQIAEEIGILGVAGDPAVTGIGVVRPLERAVLRIVVEADHLVTGRQQLLDEIAGDEPGGACHEDLHVRHAPRPK